MARRVVWSPEALADLADIYHYIKLERPQAAKRIADRLRCLARSIPDQPWIGVRCPEHDRDDLRQRIDGNYRLIYQLIGEDEIRILQIFHSRRDELPDLKLS